MRSIASGEGTDPGEIRGGDVGGEPCVLGQEAVARVDGAGAGGAGGVENGLAVEVGSGMRTASSASATKGAFSSPSV